MECSDEAERPASGIVQRRTLTALRCHPGGLNHPHVSMPHYSYNNRVHISLRGTDLHFAEDSPCFALQNLHRKPDFFTRGISAEGHYRSHYAG